MGRGFKGGTGNHSSFSDNISGLKSEYGLNNGYFGIRGEGREFIRNIICEDPNSEAKAFYDKASFGGIEMVMENGEGVYTKMKDGTIISYRHISKSDGSPAVEINIRRSTSSGEVKYQKIHFVRRKK